MKAIREVLLHFPNSDDGSIVSYQVGQPLKRGGKNVTEIKKAERCGEMAMVPYYEIYTEDGLAVEMYQYGIVYYFE